MKSRQYLAMWDIYGLECIFDITQHLKNVDDHRKKVIWNMLTDDLSSMDESPPAIPLQKLILRARYNSQRSYEIYEFCSTLSLDDIKSVFEDNPQFIVDWIRTNGYKVYSDYTKPDKKLIV